MTFDVFANHLCRHLIAHCSGEVSIFPELSAPELPLDLWKLAEHGSRTQTFETGDHLRYRVAWWKRTEDMYMVRTDFHFIYRDVVGVSYLSEHLFDSFCQQAC